MEYNFVVEFLTQRICERNGWDYDASDDPDGDASLARKDARRFLSDAQELGIIKNVEM